MDALGRTVRQQTATADAAALDLRGLPARLYLVRSGNASCQLVVE